MLETAIELFTLLIQRFLTLSSLNQFKPAAFAGPEGRFAPALSTQRMCGQDALPDL
jgi:hypothetical protein